MAIKLLDGHFKAAAESLKIHPAIVKTVAMNESPNAGFDDKGRPIILFERHKFYNYVGEILGKAKRNEIARDHSDICNSDAGGYGKAGENQWIKFSKAFRICKTAAMMSCSWGSFQEMGFNYAQIGFDTVDQFVDAMKLGLEAHLAVFIVSIRKKGLLKFLQKTVPDFHNFAEGYNGSNQEQNDYEGKMKRGYDRYKKQDWDAVQALPLVTVAELKRRTLRLTTMLDDVPHADGVAPADNADLDQQNNLDDLPDFTEGDKPTGNQTADNILNVGDQNSDEKKIEVALNEPPVLIEKTPETGFIAKVGKTITGIFAGTVAIPAIFDRFLTGEISAGTIELIKFVFPYVLAASILALIVWYLTKKINNFKLTKLLAEKNSDTTVRNVVLVPTAPVKTITQRFADWRSGVDSLEPEKLDRRGFWKSLETMTGDERQKLIGFLTGKEKVN